MNIPWAAAVSGENSKGRRMQSTYAEWDASSNHCSSCRPNSLPLARCDLGDTSFTDSPEWKLCPHPWTILKPHCTRPRHPSGHMTVLILKVPFSSSADSLNHTWPPHLTACLPLEMVGLGNSRFLGLRNRLGAIWACPPPPRSTYSAGASGFACLGTDIGPHALAPFTPM